MVGWLVDWLVGLVGWLAGWLVGVWLVGQDGSRRGAKEHESILEAEVEKKEGVLLCVCESIGRVLLFLLCSCRVDERKADGKNECNRKGKE